MKSFFKISLLILTIFFTNISDGFSVIPLIEKSETQKVSVACGNTEYWNSLKPGLESLNRQLNGSWGVNVIDKDRNSYSLVTGSQGTITYKYDKNTKNWTVDVPTATGYFQEGGTGDEYSYGFYEWDQYNRSKEPLTWGAYLVTRDLGGFFLSLAGDPLGTTIKA